MERDINVDRFREFCRTHPAVLYPAFVLQTQIQEKILGSKFWTSCSNSRVELSDGKYINIADILQVHVNEQARKALMNYQIWVPFLVPFVTPFLYIFCSLNPLLVSGRVPFLGTFLWHESLIGVALQGTRISLEYEHICYRLNAQPIQSSPGAHRHALLPCTMHPLTRQSRPCKCNG